MNGHTVDYCRKLQPGPSEKQKSHNTSASEKKINTLNAEAEDRTEQSSSEDEEEVLLNLLEQ